MGWWTMDSSTGELYVGDEPLDFVDDLLKNLARVYVEDLGRKPKLDEVCKLLELGLGTADDYLSDAGNIEVTAIQARTKKRRKRQPFEIGDFFAVPLTSEPKRYGFGRIIGDHWDYGVLIVLFKTSSDRLLTPGELIDVPLLCPPIFLGYPEPLISWRWKVIPGKPIQDGGYPTPKFKHGGSIPGDPWYVWQEGFESRIATEDEVRELETLTLYSYEAIERRMRRGLGLGDT